MSINLYKLSKDSNHDIFILSLHFSLHVAHCRAMSCYSRAREQELRTRSFVRGRSRGVAFWNIDGGCLEKIHRLARSDLHGVVRAAFTLVCVDWFPEDQSAADSD